MTEDQWLSSSDPQEMLALLRTGKLAIARKVRLFGAAVCRRLWSLLPDQRSQTAVEVVELYADGELDDTDRRPAGDEAYRAWKDTSIPDDPGEPPDKILYGSSRLWWHRPYEDDPVARRYLSPHRGIARFHAAYAAFMLTISAIDRVLTESHEAVWFGTPQSQRSAIATELQIQARFLRDLFGLLPFRPLRIDLPLLQWNDGTIPQLARAAYEERLLPSGHLDKDRLAVLADALEEAGCSRADLLDHLRGPGPHVRGCFVLDLLLGLE